jgi:hypothetical protein
VQWASAPGLVGEGLETGPAWEQAHSTFLTHAAGRQLCEGGDWSFLRSLRTIILYISRYINRLTGTDGFRVLSHQFFRSSLLLLATCISSSKTSSLTMKHLTLALLLR